jgi:hypothetical protein
MRTLAVLVCAASIFSGCVSNESVYTGKPVVADKVHYFAAWQSEDGNLYENQAGRGKWVTVPHGTIFYSGSPTTTK